MKIYLTDCTFDGILTAVYKSLKNNQNNLISTKTNYQPSIFYTQEEVETDKKSALFIKNALIKISAITFKELQTAFRSNDASKEAVIYQCALKTLKEQKNLLQNFKDVDFFNLNKLTSAVKLEAHRFKGFIRFSKMKDGIFYSKFEPCNDIIDLIFPHFKQRFYNMPFILHDVKRGVMIASYLKQTKKIENFFDKINVLDEYSKLFKTYYDTIFIKQRLNVKQMYNYMPKKYHKNLVEKNELL